MKNLITTITVFIFSVVFVLGQNTDSIQFSYINKYRIKNGKKPLIWSDTLFKESLKQTNNMIKVDSSFHSHYGSGWYSENVFYSKKTGYLTPENNVTTCYVIKNGVKIKEVQRKDVGIKDYKFFIQKYFDLTYEQVLGSSDLYFITYTIFIWTSDEYHKSILLSNDKYGSTKIVIKDVIKLENKIFDKEFYPGLGPYYYRGVVSNTFNTY